MCVVNHGSVSASAAPVGAAVAGAAAAGATAGAAAGAWMLSLSVVVRNDDVMMRRGAFVLSCYCRDFLPNLVCIFCGL